MDAQETNEAVHEAFAGSHSHFPTLVRAAMARRPLAAPGPRTARLLRSRTSAFADEVAILVDTAIEASGLGGELTCLVEDDLNPDGDVGCDFAGAWRAEGGRIVTLASSGEERDFFPVHVFCRDDGSIFIAAVDDDDVLTLSRRHVLERPRALVQDLSATLMKFFPALTFH